MDSFYRLIKSAIARRIAYVLVGFLFALMLPDEVKAETIPVQVIQVCFSSSCAPTACQAAGYGAGCYNSPDNGVTNGPGAYACFGVANCAIGTATYGCPDGYTQDGNSCTGEPPVDCNDPARDLGGAPYGGQGSLPSSICVSGCEYPLSSGVSGCKNGSCYFEASVGAPSGSCSEPSEVSEKNEDNRTPEEQCVANGQGYVSTNGIVTCVGAGTAGGGDITVRDDPLGTGTPTDTGFTDSGAVDTDGDGEPDVTKEDYCKENPFAAQCNGVFGGNCNQGFHCEGDAVMCAMARKQHLDRCEDMTVTAEAQLGESVLSGNYQLEGDTFDNPLEIDIGQLDESSFLPKGCLDDMTFPMGSGSVVLPLSQLCDGMRIAGTIVLAFAYLIAIRIVFGA